MVSASPQLFFYYFKGLCPSCPLRGQFTPAVKKDATTVLIPLPQRQPLKTPKSPSQAKDRLREVKANIPYLGEARARNKLRPLNETIPIPIPSKGAAISYGITRNLARKLGQNPTSPEMPKKTLLAHVRLWSYQSQSQASKAPLRPSKWP